MRQITALSRCFSVLLLLGVSLWPGQAAAQTPSMLDIPSTQMAAGNYHTCALTTAGGVKCWGGNIVGQLGDNSTMDRHAPVNVTGLASGVVAIATGAAHSCALITTGGVKCWGWNVYGQLGVGTITDQHVPVTIRAAQSIAFAPSQRMGWGNIVALQATASGGGTVSFDTWTPAACSISANMLTLEAPGLCGVRASQAGGIVAVGGTLAAAPQQLRVIDVDADLICANGFDLAGGLSR